MKIVINKCYGAFGLSDEAYSFLNDLYKKHPDTYFANIQNDFEYDRANPDLVKCVETLGERASAKWSSLKVVEVPDNIEDWYIDNYDGIETICGYKPQ